MFHRNMTVDGYEKPQKYVYSATGGQQNHIYPYDGRHTHTCNVCMYSGGVTLLERTTIHSIFHKFEAPKGFPCHIINFLHEK